MAAAASAPDLLFVRIAFGRAHGRELLDTQGRFLGSGSIFFGGRVRCARLERWHLRSLMEHFRSAYSGDVADRGSDRRSWQACSRTNGQGSSACQRTEPLECRDCGWRRRRGGSHLNCGVTATSPARMSRKVCMTRRGTHRIRRWQLRRQDHRPLQMSSPKTRWMHGIVRRVPLQMGRMGRQPRHVRGERRSSPSRRYKTRRTAPQRRSPH